MLARLAYRSRIVGRNVLQQPAVFRACSRSMRCSLVVMMPNWCGNRLVVRGDSASIAAFREDNKESMEDAEDETYLEELSFKRAVPLLDNEDRDERGEKWGTSQDAYEVGVSETDGNTACLSTTSSRRGVHRPSGWRRSRRRTRRSNSGSITLSQAKISRAMSNTAEEPL